MDEAAAAQLRPDELRAAQQRLEQLKRRQVAREALNEALRRGKMKNTPSSFLQHPEMRDDVLKNKNLGPGILMYTHEGVEECLLLFWLLGHL